MIPFAESKSAYEAWLAKQLGDELVATDLAAKSDAMRASGFVFLRATYWRWAEIIPEICPDLMSAPQVLAVGDIHLENYGTWRDRDGRLVWGVNDFDEAAEMPYALDLVRLSTSATLAMPPDERQRQTQGEAILNGYADGLAHPGPILLAETEWSWLREVMAVKKKAERKFWEKIDAALAAAKAADDPPPRRFVKALASSLAGRSTNFATARRKAGVGSLGRPRWIAVADRRDDEGIVHEAKALVTSAWHLARGTPNAPVRASDAANGRYRSPDPVYRAEGGIVVRRLAPDYGKFEIDKKGEPVLAPEILRAMARDLANVHLGTGNETALRDAITADLKARKSGWLVHDTAKAAAAVEQEWRSYAAGSKT